MKKDISMPKVEGVHVAVIRDKNDENEDQWNVYIINTKETALENVLVSSKGYHVDLNGNKLESSVLRHYFKSVAQKSAEKIEPIMEEVFKLHNEYFVSFYVDGNLYDKKYVFLAETINEKNFTEVPVLNKKGVLIK